MLIVIEFSIFLALGFTCLIIRCVCSGQWKGLDKLETKSFLLEIPFFLRFRTKSGVSIGFWLESLFFFWVEILLFATKIVTAYRILSILKYLSRQYAPSQMRSKFSYSLVDERLVSNVSWHFFFNLFLLSVLEICLRYPAPCFMHQ